MQKVRCFAGVGAVMAAAAGLVVGVSGSGGVADAAGIPWGQRPVTVGTGFVIGNGDVIGQPMVSKSGRWVAFVSAASNLVAGDTNGQNDLFFRDRWNDRTDRVAENVKGVQALTSSGKLLAFHRADDTYAVYNRDTKKTTTLPLQVWEAGPNDGLAVWMNDDGWYQSRIVAGREGTQNYGCEVSQLLDDGTIRGPFGCADWVPREEIGAKWSMGKRTWTTDLHYLAFAQERADNPYRNVLPVYDLFKSDMLTGDTLRMSVQTKTAMNQIGFGQVAVSNNGRYVAAIREDLTLLWWDTIAGVQHVYRSDAYNHDYSWTEPPVVLDDGRVVAGANPKHATTTSEFYILTVRFGTDGAATVGKTTARWDSQLISTWIDAGQYGFASDINRIIACSYKPVGPLDTNTFTDCNLVPIANA